MLVVGGCGAGRKKCGIVRSRFLFGFVVVSFGRCVVLGFVLCVMRGRCVGGSLGCVA